MTLCPHCSRPMNQIGKYGLECTACSLAMQTGGDIPLNRPTGPAEDDLRDRRLQSKEEITGVTVDLVKVYERMKKWLKGKA